MGSCDREVDSMSAPIAWIGLWGDVGSMWEIDAQFGSLSPFCVPVVLLGNGILCNLLSSTRFTLHQLLPPGETRLVYYGA